MSGSVVFRVSAVAALACAALLVVLPGASGKPGGSPCGVYPFADSSTHWEAVFGHRTSTAEAILLRRTLAAKAFQGVQLEQDYCDDVELEVPGVDSPSERESFAKEADASGVPVSFEPPDNQKANGPGEVSAVFGHRPTLKRASDLLGDVAVKGWREVDIVRVALHDWKVVLHHVPASAESDLANEARSAGYAVTFEG